MRRAHRGVWCSKSTPLIEAELFAAERRRPAPSGRALLCAADNAREIQGITAFRKLPDARNRAPVTPVSLRDRKESRRKGGFGGVKRGQGNHLVPLPPFAPAAGRRQSLLAVGTTYPAGEHRHPRRRSAAMHSHVMANIPRLGRVCLACGGKPPERRNRSPSAEGKNRGAPPDRRKGLPPADDKVFKDLQSLLQRLFLKSLAFHPAVRYNKTTRRGKAFTSRISLTALSHRKGAKAIRTAGSNAEHGNFVALLNFYKLAD